MDRCKRNQNSCHVAVQIMLKGNTELETGTKIPMQQQWLLLLLPVMIVLLMVMVLAVTVVEMAGKIKS